MSAEAATAPNGILTPDLALSRQRAKILRLAFGMTLSAAIGLGLVWPLSFITPVLAAKLLTMPKVMPPKAAIGFLVVLSGSLMVGGRVFLPTLSYPAVHLLLTALALFLLFYAKAGGMKPILVVLLTLGVLVVPVIGTVSVSLALATIDGLIFAAIVAVGLVYVAAAVFPDPVGIAPGATAEAEAGAGEGEATDDASPTPKVRAALALRSLVVLFPFAVAFQLFSITGATVALVMAILLGLESEYGKHLKVGKGLILANVAGGLVAVVIYQLLTWVPAFPFFLLLVFLAGLWVGGWIFSDRLLGKLFGGGITTFFLILGPTVTGEAEAGSALLVRILYIIGAVVYVVLAFGLLERLTRGRRWVE